MSQISRSSSSRSSRSSTSRSSNRSVMSNASGFMIGGDSEGGGGGKDAKKAFKMLNRKAPHIINTFATLCEFFIKREHQASMDRQPIEHYSILQTLQAATDMIQTAQLGFLSREIIADHVNNLLQLQLKLIKLSPEYMSTFNQSFRRLVVMTGDIAVALDKVSGMRPTNWNQILTLIDRRNAQCKTTQQINFREFVPLVNTIQAQRLLGAGGFGAVYKATYLPAKLVMSVKIIPSDRFKKSIQAATDKIVASMINSDFLVRYYSCFATENAYVTLMEYIPGVDLNKIVTRTGVIDRILVQLVIVQMYLGIEHLHLRGFIHRDIKVQNVLIKAGGRLNVIDFDTNKCCLGHFLKTPLASFFRRTPEDFCDGETAGTLPYMPPEILLKKPYGRSVDLWALGVTCYKLTVGRLPFRGKNPEMVSRSITEDELEWPTEGSTATPECKDFVSRLLIKNPVMRLGSATYKDIRNHPFFKEVDLKFIETNKHLAEIPHLREAMNPSNKNPNVPPSPEASGGSAGRAKLKIADLVDLDKDKHVPMMSFTSPSMKKLMQMIWNVKRPVIATPEDMAQALEKSEDIKYEKPKQQEVVEIKLPPKILETADIQVFRQGLGSCFSNGTFGFQCKPCVSTDSKNYLVVTGLKPNSPAAESQIRVGDIIIRINGVDIGGFPYSKSITAIDSPSGNSLTLSIAIDNIFRFLGDNNSMRNFLQTMTIVDVAMCIEGLGFCGGKQELIQIESTDAGSPGLFYHLVLYVPPCCKVVNPPNGRVISGDVITHINGMKADNINNASLLNMMVPKGFTVTLLCSSPLRITLPDNARAQDMQQSAPPSPAGAPKKDGSGSSISRSSKISSIRSSKVKRK